MSQLTDWERACAESQLKQYQAALRLQHAESLIGRITTRLEERGLSVDDYNLLLQAKNLLEEFHITEDM